MIVIRDNKIPIVKETIDEFIKFLFPNLPDLVSTSKQQTRELVEARQFAMYLHYYYDMSCPSLSSIGRAFNKDHATVLHAFKKINNINSVDSSSHLYFTANVISFHRFIISKQNSEPEFAQKQIERKISPNHARKFFIPS